MPKNQIDVAKLYGALDGARAERGLSWRALAKELGVSPSMLARIGNGYKPDADGFITLTRWLGVPAESFTVDPSTEVRDQPDLMSELKPLLRARRDLNKRDINYLEEIFQASVRRVQQDREARE